MIRIGYHDNEMVIDSPYSQIEHNHFVETFATLDDMFKKYQPPKPEKFSDLKQLREKMSNQANSPYQKYNLELLQLTDVSLSKPEQDKLRALLIDNFGNTYSFRMGYTSKRNGYLERVRQGLSEYISLECEIINIANKIKHLSSSQYEQVQLAYYYMQMPENIEQLLGNPGLLFEMCDDGDNYNDDITRNDKIAHLFNRLLNKIGLTSIAVPTYKEIHGQVTGHWNAVLIEDDQGVLFCNPYLQMQANAVGNNDAFSYFGAKPEEIRELTGMACKREQKMDYFGRTYSSLADGTDELPEMAMQILNSFSGNYHFNEEAIIHPVQCDAAKVMEKLYASLQATQCN